MTAFVFTGQGCEMLNMNRIPYNTDSALAAGAVELWANLQRGALPQSCVDALQSGASTFTTTSNLMYEDIFRSPHSTGICAQYEGTASRRLTSCATGNYAQ